MKHSIADPSQSDLIDSAGEAYHRTLARWGLTNLSEKELAQARQALHSPDRPPVADATIEFEAAFNRLHSRRLSPAKIEEALKDIFAAEYDCDQAQWERDCHHLAMMSHMHFRLVPKE